MYAEGREEREWGIRVEGGRDKKRGKERERKEMSGQKGEY